MIKIKNVTKDYGGHKGIFDLSIEIEDGEVFGLLGPEGAGKTTLIQLLMGFSFAARGRCIINRKNCMLHAKDIHSFTGYLPEEVAYPEDMTGIAFIRFMAELKKVRNLEKALNTAGRFELDLDKKIKKMTKSEKQKLGIANAFISDPAVFLFDEPMSGLDPLMQGRFVDLIQEEKERGKTIFLTTHIFEEVERTCDRVGMIHHGMMAGTGDIEWIRKEKKKIYVITFASGQEAQNFTKEDFDILNISGTQVTVSLGGEMKPLLKTLGQYDVISLETVAQRLSEVFKHFFGGDIDA